MGFFNDIVNGKEKKAFADPLAGDINNAAKKGIDQLKFGSDKLGDVYSRDPSGVVANQIATENKLLRSSADDAARKTEEIIARRGMGNSSIGLGETINQERSLSDRLAMNNASEMERKRQMEIDNGQGLMNTGSGLFNIKQAQGPIQMNDIKYRTGGYAQLLAPAIQGGIMAMGKPR